MNHALLLNFMIVTACLVALSIHAKPTVPATAPGMVDMPFSLLQAQAQYSRRDDELEGAEGGPIGFTTDIR
jgi:hypothetical protein